MFINARITAFPHSSVFVFLGDGSFTSNFASSAVSQNVSSLSPLRKKMEPYRMYIQYVELYNKTIGE